MGMLKPDRKPYVPEPREKRGPGVDVWNGVEKNNDPPTDHEVLMSDRERRKRIADRIAENARIAAQDH